MKVGRFTSSYLKAEELVRPTVITVEKVAAEVLEHEGREEEKLVLYAARASRGIALSKTGISQLTEIFNSDDTDDWLRKRCVVFCDASVTFGGRKVGGIRFRPVEAASSVGQPNTFHPAAAASPAPEPPKEQAPPAAQAGDWPPPGEDVPF